MAKLPAFQFYTGDWLKDPALSLCSPSTRGIWIDLLCAMHEQDRSGTITGTITQLCRLCRCSDSEMRLAIDELKTTKTANVTERNGNVTVINRRMQTQAKERVKTRVRVQNHRSNGNVTELKQRSNAYSSSSTSTSVQESNKTHTNNAREGPPLLELFVVDVIAGLKERLGIKNLPARLEWEKCAEWAFGESFSREQFLETFDLLGQQNWRSGPVKARHIAENLPNLSKLRKEIENQNNERAKPSGKGSKRTDADVLAESAEFYKNYPA